MDKMPGVSPTILTSAFKVNRMNIPCKSQRLSNFKGKKKPRPDCMPFTGNVLHVDLQVESMSGKRCIGQKISIRKLH